jgi:hypothetical protein
MSSAVVSPCEAAEGIDRRRGRRGRRRARAAAAPAPVGVFQWASTDPARELTLEERRRLPEFADTKAVAIKAGLRGVSGYALGSGLRTGGALRVHHTLSSEIVFEATES